MQAWASGWREKSRTHRGVNERFDFIEFLPEWRRSAASARGRMTPLRRQCAAEVVHQRILPADSMIEKNCLSPCDAA
jgi:hypothetical protein